MFVKRLVSMALLALSVGAAFASDTNDRCNAFLSEPVVKLPTTTFFLDQKVYSSIKTAIGNPPALDSAEQKADEAELFRLQRNRTAEDCERALEKLNLASFFGPPRGPLSAAEVAALTTLSSKIENDANYFTEHLKEDLPRERPFHYIPGIEPCVRKKSSKSYPSGHAAISKLYALLLGEVFPHMKAELEARAAEAGHNRVLAGVHHPSDIYAGRKLAELLFAEFKRSKKFRSQISKIKAQLN